MLIERALIGFVPTLDLERARDFYTEMLGLTLIESNELRLRLRLRGTMLRVTAVGEHVAAPYTVLGWAVDDIEGDIALLSSRGIEFLRYDGMDQNSTGVWTTPERDTIAWFRDPDSNVLSLTQFADDVSL